MFHTRRLALASLACAAAAPAWAAEDPALEQLIDRHTKARGGAAALDRIKAEAIDLEITEGGQTINGRYLASVERLVRIDIIVDGKRVYSEGVDPKGVWLWPGDAPEPRPSVAEGAANALLHGVESNLIGLHRFRSRGSALKLMPSETIDGVVYPVVEVTYSSGHKTYLYLDPKTWMIVRKRDERAYHPDVDQTKKRVESRFSDFQTQDGVVDSNLSEDYDLATGAKLSSARVLKRVINPPLPEGVFDRTYTPA